MGLLALLVIVAVVKLMLLEPSVTYVQLVITTSRHVQVNAKNIYVFVICINEIFIFMISACNCNQHGSTGACDDNGKCNCRAHFKNDKCDACTDGSEIFPHCDLGKLCFLHCSHPHER